jgi:biopolymer transport protein ExbD
MRLTRQKHTIGRPQLNMASMIDVVFLLLIFFMCTSSFSRPERSLSARLPEAGLSDGASRDDLDPVRVRLSPAGGGVGITCDNQPCATTGDLLSMLRARRAMGQPPVIISGHDDVPFGPMVAALDACRRADLQRVAFAAGRTGP